jgi:hypothetical protein
MYDVEIVGVFAFSVLRLLVVLREGRRVCWDSLIDAWGL